MSWTLRTILTVLVVTVTAACGGKSAQAPGEPRFTSVRLTDTRDSTEEKTVFTGDTPKIYAIFTIAAVPARTTIKSVWIAEKTDVAPADHKIDEATLTMGIMSRQGPSRSHAQRTAGLQGTIASSCTSANA